MTLLSNGVSIKDVNQGKGAGAKQSSCIQVHYSCKLESSKKMILKDCETEFTLGGEGVIQGWNIGAKKGSRRVVYCPAKTAYGMVGCPPLIPRNSDLVYTMGKDINF